MFYLPLSHHDPLAIAGLNLNAGFAALAVNMIVFVALSLLTSTAESAAQKAKAITA